MAGDECSFYHDRGMVYAGGPVRATLTNHFLSSYVSAREMADAIFGACPVADLLLPTPLILPAVTGFEYPVEMPSHELLVCGLAAVRAAELAADRAWLLPQLETVLARLGPGGSYEQTLVMLRVVFDHVLIGVGAEHVDSPLGLVIPTRIAVLSETPHPDAAPWTPGLLSAFTPAP